jgi:uncharacterized protein (DUF427 family)
VPVEPGPGQESAWAYPRPPRLERSSERIRIVLGGVTIVDTRHSWRVLETASPPTYYIDRDDFDGVEIRPAPGHSLCEWKGQASYVDLVAGGVTSASAGWWYPQPTAPFAAIAEHLAVYANRVDRCMVDDEVVQAQDGDFYGGWITSRIVGPFKGQPGTTSW